MKSPVIFGAAAAAFLALSSVSMAQPSTIVVDTVVGYKSIGGNPARIEILIARPQNADAQAAADRALAAVGARREPPLGEDFILLGGAWPQFFDRVRRNNYVTLNYNPAGDPTGGAARAAILRAEETWSSVPGSSFRIRDGGVTGRCPSLSEHCQGSVSHLDGTNDIGWVSIDWNWGGPDFLPAYAMVVIDGRTGEILESDISLNKDIAWFTDGCWPDVEALALHEIGHSVGFDHNFDPASINFCCFDVTMRALGAVDSNGVRALYPIHPSVLTESHTANGYEIIGEIGQPAPGGGVLEGLFEPGGVNVRGQVAFVTDVAEGQALFVSDAHGLHQIARSGHVIAGIPLGIGSTNHVSINDAGLVVFAWFVDSPSGPMDASALFLADARGVVVPLVVPGAYAPGGGTFVISYSPELSNRGEVAFNALIDFGGSTMAAVCLVSPKGTIETVARPGERAPGGGTFTWVGLASISSKGDVAFAARTTSTNNLGVYLRDGNTGELTVVARPGDEAPGGGRFAYATQPRVNAHGDVLFGGSEVGQPSWLRSLYLARTSRAIERVAAPGDVMPDGWRFYSATASSWLTSWTINDNRDVAFLASVHSAPNENPWGGEPYVLYSNAVYASNGGTLRAVIRERTYMIGGDVLLGVGQVASVTTQQAVLLANNGSVVVQVLTQFGRVLLLRTGAKF